MIDGRAKPTIAQLNDELRQFHRGGKIVVSAGLDAAANEGEKPFGLEAVIMAVAAFNDFNEDNDPYGEHDNAIVDVEGFGKVMFKIDYYSPDYKWGSEDPSDPKQTARVMTIMKPEDY